ncbi:ran guanine nucleotide release factor-like isoform X2 [Dreissena polymorpha]|nr:ran guanine nucleotide release factor-like isoform X2 [Dreissena polymorpha]
MSEQQLFGGAFTVTLPEARNDMSVVRQIPDNQEVFVHPGTDQSIIIELMEAVDSQQPDEHAISTHFEDLATTNGAAGDSKIVRLEQIPIENISLQEAESCWYILGEQNISKFNEAAKNSVEIHMGLLRVPKYTTDILITFNDPINISLDSSSHQPVATSTVRWHSGDFRTALTTLTLQDPGIFGV